MINITKFIYVLLFLIPISNVIGNSIINYTDINSSSTTSSSTTSPSISTTTTTTDNKDMSLAEILITVCSVALGSIIVVYCCCKCNEQEDNNRW